MATRVSLQSAASGEALQPALITDRRLWNDFVASCATGHLCQTYEWADNSGEATGVGSLRVGVLQGGKLVAAMLLVRSRATGVPLPFFYAPRGPVCDDPTSPALPLLIAFAKREARRAGGFFIRAEPNVVEDDSVWPGALQRLGFHATSHHIYLRSAWVTDLRPNEDAILANMMTTWRQNIRAGGRKGLTVRVGAGEADLDAFYRLLVETGERDHFYVYPKALFRDMLTNYSAGGGGARRDGADGAAAGRDRRRGRSRPRPWRCLAAGRGICTAAPRASPSTASCAPTTCCNGSACAGQGARRGATTTGARSPTRTS